MSWTQRFSNVLRPKRLSREIERELSFHIAEKAEALQSEGFSPSEAERLARLNFGNFASHTEQTREMNLNLFLDSALRHLRHTLRSLANAPAFTATVILTLALGIGANTAVFSAIDTVLLRPLPYFESDRLVKISQTNHNSQAEFVAPIRLADWVRLNSSFSSITGYYEEDVAVTTNDLPEKLRRAWIAPDFGATLGVVPSLGRYFTAQEEHFGGPSAVLISDRLWRNQFAANPSIIGSHLRAPRSGPVIVGVMPAGFHFPDRGVDLWSPVPLDAPFAQSRENTWFIVVGRLRPSVSLAQARADLSAVQANLARLYPKTDAAITPLIQPLKEATIGGIGKSLWLLFASVSLLLLIACTNVAALLLSRATSRKHEIGIRFSIGASRSSVVIQMLSEVFALAFAGAALGLFFTALASRLFVHLVKDIPRIEDIHLDLRILLYSLVCTFLVTLICGLFPALRGTREGLASTLAVGGRTQVSTRTPLSFVLVATQVALSVTLLSGAGLLLRSFQELNSVSPGFDPSHILTFHISSSWAETGSQVASQRTARILDALRSIPSVDSAAVANFLPGVPGGFQVELKTSEGRAPTAPKLVAETRWVTPEYFSTLRIPLGAGELCRQQNSSLSVVVNRRFADLFLNGNKAIGYHLSIPSAPFVPAAQISGIVGDARETGLDRPPAPTVYWCNSLLQPGTNFLVRTRLDPASLSTAVRRKVHEVEPLRSVYDLSPLTDHISDAFAENRLRTVLLVFFALTAISLSSIGLYGTISYLVTVRRREVAVRLAVGALRGQVIRHFLTQGLRISAAGALVGLFLAAVFARLLSGMLFGISPTDIRTWAGVITNVLAVSIIASLVPAFRASRLDPMQSLRQD